MKYIWEKKDIKMGCLVEYAETEAENRFSIIGYNIANGSIAIVSLCDGSIFFEEDVSEMLVVLNAGYAPVRQPVHTEDLVNKCYKQIF